jgi:hypothetical protein
MNCPNESEHDPAPGQQRLAGKVGYLLKRPVSTRYPEAAVAYHEAFLIDVAKKCGFREVTVAPKKGQSELVALK